MTKNKVSLEELKSRQALSLEDKVRLSQIKIEEWCEIHKGKVYVAFSGGKDSTALLHLVRSIYPDVPAVFCNTGLEYPEIKDYIRTVPNVVWIKPKMSFRQVIDKYGYPVTSKENAQKIHEIRTTKSKKLLYKRLNGADNEWKSGKLPLKWRPLIDAPFKISHVCCDILKKNPAKKYEKETGRVRMEGTMASDGLGRRQTYQRNGCSSFVLKRPCSRAIGFWVRKDVNQYIKIHNIKISSIYSKGYDHTGCIFCMFGVHMQKSPNKFQLLKETHPRLWKYCTEKLNLKEVLTFIGCKYE